MGSLADWREVIPGVLLHVSSEPFWPTLRRLFPQSYFASLWAKYPTKFNPPGAS